MKITLKQLEEKSGGQVNLVYLGLKTDWDPKRSLRQIFVGTPLSKIREEYESIVFQDEQGGILCEVSPLPVWDTSDVSKPDLAIVVDTHDFALQLKETKRIYDLQMKTLDIYGWTESMQFNSKLTSCYFVRNRNITMEEIPININHFDEALAYIKTIRSSKNDERNS